MDIKIYQLFLTWLWGVRFLLFSCYKATNAKLTGLNNILGFVLGACRRERVCDQYNFICLFCLRCIWISFEATIQLPIFCPVWWPGACSQCTGYFQHAVLALSVYFCLLLCIKCLIKTKTMKLSLGWKENLFPLCLFYIQGIVFSKEACKVSGSLDVCCLPCEMWRCLCFVILVREFIPCFDIPHYLRTICVTTTANNSDNNFWSLVEINLICCLFQFYTFKCFGLKACQLMYL